MDTIQAAVLMAKLDIFQSEIKLRQDIAEKYNLFLRNVNSVTIPYIEKFNTSVYAQYTIQVENRSIFQEKLKEASVPTAIHYPIALNKQPCFSSNSQEFPVANKVSKKVISLPIHPYLDEQGQECVINSVVNSIHI